MQLGWHQRRSPSDPRRSTLLTTPEMWRDAQQPFLDTLQELSPHLVLVLGLFTPYPKAFLTTEGQDGNLFSDVLPALTPP